MIKPTQADRYAAATFGLRHLCWTGAFAVEVADGKHDGDPVVIAFTSHAQQARLEEWELADAVDDAAHNVAIAASGLVVATDGMEALRPTRKRVLDRLKAYSSARSAYIAAICKGETE